MYNIYITDIKQIEIGNIDSIVKSYLNHSVINKTKIDLLNLKRTGKYKQGLNFDKLIFYHNKFKVGEDIKFVIKLNAHFVRYMETLWYFYTMGYHKKKIEVELLEEAKTYFDTQNLKIQKKLFSKYQMIWECKFM